jgi:hypothetical protein
MLIRPAFATPRKKLLRIALAMMITITVKSSSRRARMKRMNCRKKEACCAVAAAPSFVGAN